MAQLGTRGIPARYGGTETYVENLSLYLASQGDEVVVYCKKGNCSDQDVCFPPNIHLIEVPSIPTKHLDNITRTFLSTIQACLDPAIDLVQFNNVGPSFFSFLPRLFGKKVVGAVRAIDSSRAKWNPLASRFLRLCERLVLIWPHATTVNAVSIQQHYLDKHRAQTYYIPNGVDVSQGTYMPQGIYEWGLTERDYILFAARLEPEKGCHTLIAAFNHLISNARAPGSLRLVIAGSMDRRSKYVQELLRNQSERIVFTDHVSGETLAELYQNAFAFVLPSAVEGMSNSLLVAMAHGVPVVVSNIPENLAVIEEVPYSDALQDRPGLSFELDDPIDLAEKMHILLKDPEAARQRGSLLRSHAMNHFSVESMGEQTRRLYESLLSSSA